MRNQVVTLGDITNDDNGICTSQTAVGAEALDIDGALATGGVASWPTAQKITVTSAGDDSGIDFVIVGQDPNGKVISETIDGAAVGAASTTAYFKTCTSVTTTGATAAAVIVGVLAANGACSRSLRVNREQPNFKLGLFVDVISGTLTYSGQYTYDQPEDAYPTSFNTDARWLTPSALSSKSADAQDLLEYPINCVRLILTAYTSGSVQLTVTQTF